MRQLIPSLYFFVPNELSTQSGELRNVFNRPLTFGQLNICSLRYKTASVLDVILTHQLDFLVLTETWHEPNDNVLRRATPPGFVCFGVARPIPSTVSTASDSFVNHGGIALVFRDRFSCQKKILDFHPSTFEILCLYISGQGLRLVLVAIYRPGSSPVTAACISEFKELFERLAHFSCGIILCGDLNFHFDSPASSWTSRINALFDMFGYKQMVDSPTHIAGHILDVVVIRLGMSIQNLLVECPGFLSDHSVITFCLPVHTNCTKYSVVTRRSWKRFDRNTFLNDLTASPLCERHLIDDLSADELMNLYNLVLTQLLDTHCPYTSFKSYEKPMAPWFDNECRSKRRECRAHERRFRRSKALRDLEVWKSSSRQLRCFYNKKEAEYWRNLIELNRGNPKKLWTSFQSLGCRQQTNHIRDDQIDAKNLANYFQQKVDDLRRKTLLASDLEAEESVNNTLSNWRRADHDTVIKLIQRAPNKSCELDPAPTWIIKQCAEVLAPFLVILFNKSLDHQCFPATMKHAVIYPLLKAQHLNSADVHNYRPISNLCFLAKLFEKFVCLQLTRHVDENNFLPIFQSAYRSGHNTECVMLKIFNDLSMAIDSGRLSFLCLLDLSAAFDTIDHVILIRRLSVKFGIHGPALNWLSSYLSDRTQTVKYNNQCSDLSTPVCGVPQGSILGPCLFIMYTSSLSDVICRTPGMSFHSYADDTQLYNSFYKDDIALAESHIKECFKNCRTWMDSNRLALNVNKTKLLLCGSRHRTHDVHIDSIALDGNPIALSDYVNDLGVLLDNHLSLSRHVQNVVRSCYFHIRQLSHIRRCIDTASFKSLIGAFVFSRVDYCNSILINAPAITTRPLQSVLNSAARLVTGTTYYDHITPVLQELHWLKIDDRIRFKVGTMVFKCLHGLAPSYLSDLLIPISAGPSQRRTDLRASSSGDLCIPQCRSSMGERSFSVAGPRLWNSLPQSVRSCNSLATFKHSLKTFLFQRSFNTV